MHCSIFYLSYCFAFQFPLKVKLSYGIISDMCLLDNSFLREIQHKWNENTIFGGEQAAHCKLGKFTKRTQIMSEEQQIKEKLLTRSKFTKRTLIM